MRFTDIPFTATAADTESTRNGMSSLFNAIRIIKRPRASVKLSSAMAAVPALRSRPVSIVNRAASSVALASKPSFSPGSAVSANAETIAFSRLLYSFPLVLAILAAAMKSSPEPASIWLSAMSNDKIRCNFITKLMTPFERLNKSRL